MFERLVLGLLIVLVGLSAANADTIELDNGRKVTGTIVREAETYVVIETTEGERKVIRIGRIREIVRGKEAEEQPEAEAFGETVPSGLLDFRTLSKVEREIANGRAMYVLGDYDTIIPRLKPLLDNDLSKEEQSQVNWLLIESHERLAEFDEAKALLEKVKGSSLKADRVRAKAHLDLLEQNPGATLRRVNDVMARDFLSRENRLRGKRSNALADDDLMRLALEEYCHQILTDEDVSLRTVQQSMEREFTLAAIRAMPPRAADVVSYLPFAKDIKRVEASLDRVDAILPDYARCYRIDLIRSEAIHMSDVLTELFNEVVADYPDYDPPSDEHGRLTKEGREQWRERCEDFAEALRPLLLIAEHLQERVSRYPDRLRDLKLQYATIVSQLEYVRAATLRNKERTRV